MHLPATVDAEVLRMQTSDPENQEIVLQLPGRRRAVRRGVEAAGREESSHRRSEHLADELDPETIPVLVDEPDNLVEG